MIVSASVCKYLVLLVIQYIYNYCLVVGFPLGNMKYILNWGYKRILKNSQIIGCTNKKLNEIHCSKNSTYNNNNNKYNAFCTIALHVISYLLLFTDIIRLKLCFTSHGRFSSLHIFWQNALLLKSSVIFVTLGHTYICHTYIFLHM